MAPEVQKTQVIIGVGVVLRRDDEKFLMLKRKGGHGEGEWALPGGRVEYGESFEGAAKRELMEETGIDVAEGRVISLSNQLRYICQGVHCVIVGVEMMVSGGTEPKILEPEKCEEMSWFDLQHLPDKVFEGSEQIIRRLRGEGEEIGYLK